MTPIFVDRARPPTDDAVEASLGAGYALWLDLKARLALEYVPLDEAWAYSGKAYGWSLRLRHRDRPVVYLTPLVGRFRASLALPERAVPSALSAGLPAPIQAIVAGARTYPEGRAIRIEVASEADIASVVALIRVRMAS